MAETGSSTFIICRNSYAHNKLNMYLKTNSNPSVIVFDFTCRLCIKNKAELLDTPQMYFCHPL